MSLSPLVPCSIARLRPRRVAALALAVAGLSVGLAAPAAHAAKTYSDPWLEGDLQQLRVPQALDELARTPVHVIVGDVDSGARLTDPDLSARLVRMTTPYTCADEYGPGPSYAADPANGDFGCDFVGTGGEGGPTTVPDGDPTDPFGHGTGTAAIIAATPNNGLEGAGVAPNARVLPVRACYGGNPDCFNEPALDAFKYAVTMGATVINASWPPGDDYSAAFRAFVHDRSAVLFVFAIGGSDQDDDPYKLCTDRATYPNVVCVGLANPDDTAGTVNAQTQTDVSAPGYAGVPSASGARAEFGYTSGATAHVSGAAALLRGLAPDLSASTIRQVLVSTSRHVAGYETANRAGGVVDVEAAVRAVQQMVGLTTPAAGQGAPADSPDPFAGQTTPVGTTPPGQTTSTATTTTPLAQTTPAATTTAPGPTQTGTTPAPGAGPAPGGPPTTPTAPTASSPTPTPGTSPSAPSTSGRVTLSLGRLPRTVRAGASLQLRVDVVGGTGTVTATLAHSRTRLATATKAGAHGVVTVRLRLSKRAKRGRATLTVRCGAAAPVVRRIVVTRRG